MISFNSITLKVNIVTTFTEVIKMSFILNINQCIIKL